MSISRAICSRLRLAGRGRRRKKGYDYWVKKQKDFLSAFWRPFPGQEKRGRAHAGYLDLCVYELCARRGRTGRSSVLPAKEIERRGVRGALLFGSAKIYAFPFFPWRGARDGEKAAGLPLRAPRRGARARAECSDTNAGRSTLGVRLPGSECSPTILPVRRSTI